MEMYCRVIQREVIPNLEFPNVRNTDVKQIWYDSPAFNKFRGTDWMKEPCRSCSEKENDLGWL
jgi:pyrroloquinoline quinone biosynthesis protein E